MASLAQRLPVVYVPEEFRVSVMWPDVVDFSGRCKNSLSIAHDTKSVINEISIAGGLPAAVVSTLGSRSSALIDLALLLQSVHFAS